MLEGWGTSREFRSLERSQSSWKRHGDVARRTRPVAYSTVFSSGQLDHPVALRGVSKFTAGSGDRAVARDGTLGLTAGSRDNPVAQSGAVVLQSSGGWSIAFKNAVRTVRELQVERPRRKAISNKALSLGPSWE